MIFDTDVLIWVQRGNMKAARLVDRTQGRCISVVTYLELVQTAQNRQQLQYVKDFLVEYGFQMLPLTENIGHRSTVYIEEYTLSHGLRANDALIAATATESNLILCSGNTRHFKAIKDLKLKVFKP